MRLIKCDLCNQTEEKPHGSPPEDWFTYSKANPINFCPPCKKAVKQAISRRAET